MAKTSIYFILAFICYLLLCNVRGKLSGSHEKQTKNSKTTTELHRRRLKEAVKAKSVSNGKQNGGAPRQVSRDGTRNSTTNNELKRTMKVGSKIALKNTVNSAPFRRPLRLLRLKTASPFVRSRLTSLRSSTFKPIHIYGSVPFKTFLTALSKSNGQGMTAPTPALQSDVPQVASAPNMPAESPLLQTKALQSRPLPSPGGIPVPLEPQGGMPMFLPGAGGGPGGLPLEGPMPMIPQADMANFYGFPQGYHEHHTINHHLHRKGKIINMKTKLDLVSILGWKYKIERNDGDCCYSKMIFDIKYEI